MEELLGRSMGSVFANTLVSLVFALVMILLRAAVLRAGLQRAGISPENRRRWIVNSRNALLLILVIGLVFIWADELLTFAVSLVAIAAAIVIATKELILCFSGAVLRTASKSFALGDLIEIGGVRGDVIDVNVFAATIREVGPGKGSHQYTGRAVTVPNSLLLNAPLVNHSFMGEYIMHIVTLPWNFQDDWTAAEKLLLESAEAECAPFIEDARIHMKKLENRHGFESLSIEPRVTIEIPDPGKIIFQLRIPAPVRRQSRLEQAILRRFLTAWVESRPASPLTREEPFSS